MLRSFVFVLSLLIVSACTSVPFDAPRVPTRALPTEGTEASRLASDLSGGGASRIAMAPLVDGNDALGARLRLIQTAEHSIDLKTFLIKPDIAGTLMWLALYEAAERGVRVRLLFDDVFTTARDDQIATLDAHPNVEIRAFNPLSRNSLAIASYAFDFKRVNRRMHNKAMIIDGALAIIGGRNIADEYYQIGADSEFADFDLFVAGAPVEGLSEAFDLFWNDRWSVPLAALEEGDETPLRQALVEFQASAAREEVEIYDRAINSVYLAQLRSGAAPIYSGTAHVVVDNPEKLRNSPRTGPFVVGNTLYSLMNTAESEVLLLTPYFIPEDYGARFFSDLVQRGVRVRIVTNSLAATNHPYVHGAYSRYRSRLLEAGVEFLEVRADATSIVEGLNAPLTMHSKFVVVDRKTMFVGSPNIDPRSIRQNAEIGMILESRELAQDILNGVNESATDYTFALTQGEEGKTVWTYGAGERVETFTSEPGATFWDRFIATVSGWLPIESQL